MVPRPNMLIIVGIPEALYGQYYTQLKGNHQQNPNLQKARRNMRLGPLKIGVLNPKILYYIQMCTMCEIILKEIKWIQQARGIFDLKIRYYTQNKGNFEQSTNMQEQVLKIKLVVPRVL